MFNLIIAGILGYMAGNPQSRKSFGDFMTTTTTSFVKNFEKKGVVRNDRTSANVAEVSTPSNITSTTTFEQPKPEQQI